MIPEPVVILANGDFPSHKEPLNVLKDANTIICCDGSVNHLVKNSIEPNYIIGDLDSIEDNLKSKYEDRVIELSDQNENDLRKAIKWAEDIGARATSILGATGKRDDHNLANIVALLQYPCQLKMTMFTNYGIFSVVKNEQRFDSFKGQQVSLFSTESNIEVTSINLKYNLINNKLTNLYCGSLNESINKEFTINISHGQILVYQVYE